MGDLMTKFVVSRNQKLSLAPYVERDGTHVYPCDRCQSTGLIFRDVCYCCAGAGVFKIKN